MREFRKLENDVSNAVDKSINILNSVSNNMGEVIQANKTRLENYKNLDTIVEDIDKEFAKKTSILNKKDQIFLWTAVALQTVRWLFITDFKDRIDDQKAAKETKGHTEEHSNRIHSLYNPSIDEIISNPVPFDTVFGAKIIGSDIAQHGGHRFTTLGHDPVLGWVFGTANIATSTITDYKLQSYHVKTGTIATGAARDKLALNARTDLVFKYTADKMFNQGTDGKKIIAVSLIKEAVHLLSDVNTVHGLPIPLVSLNSPELASKLSKYGLDTANIINVGKQFAYAAMINTIIKMIHLLMFDEAKDVDFDLYRVRTSKILAVSNIIAESLNIAYVVGHVATGLITDNPLIIRNGLKKIDIGGYIEAVHQIVSSVKLQEKIRREFLEKKLYEKFVGEEYSFMEA